MNAPTNTANLSATADEVASIEGALDALLTAALKADEEVRRRHRASDDRPQMFKSFRLGAIFEKTRAQSLAEQIVRNPIGEAACQAVTPLGVRLHEVGGLDLMQQVLDRVAERDPPNWGRRTTIMDHRWDGIGRTDKSAGWCA